MTLFKKRRVLSCSSSFIAELYDGSPLLEAVHLAGQENINQLFEYSLILKTPNDSPYIGVALHKLSKVDLQDWIGKEVSIQISLAGSGAEAGAEYRYINGLVFDACFLREESSQVKYYKVTIKPWLALATLNSDCRLFQNKSVIEVIDEVLSKKYNFIVEKQLNRTFPVRDLITQMNESDYHFVARLCQTWGINFYFEHQEKTHKLILADNMGAWLANKAYPKVNYHPAGYKNLDVEHLDYFSLKQTLVGGKYTTNDYDYSRAGANLAVSKTHQTNNLFNDAETYQWHEVNSSGSNYVQPKAGAGQASNEPKTEGETIFADLRMAALRSKAQRAIASGSLRAMQAGKTFKLLNQPIGKQTEWLILASHLEIEDIGFNSTPIQNTNTNSLSKIPLKTPISPLTGEFSIQVELELFPANEFLVPDLTLATPKANSPQVAKVVGAESSIWTDNFARIKIAYPWSRNDPQNEQSCCWVRVAAMGGNNGNRMGTINIPRLGQEAIIDYIDGNLDLPICVGTVHNSLNFPPFELPKNSALSGYRSREFSQESGGNYATGADGHSNHLVFDDTAKKIGVHLRSDFECSSISLGYITRIEDGTGRKEGRGKGFEIRSDANGIIRSGKGMLISTDIRHNAQSHLTDISESSKRLQQAQEQHKNLADLAQRQEAQDSDADQSTIADNIKRQNSDIQGKGSADNTNADFPELQDSNLVLASASGIVSNAAQSTHIASGAEFIATSGSNTSQSVGGSWLASVTKNLRFFANQGIRLFSGKEKIQIQSNQNDINIIAKKVVEIISQSDWVEIKGKKGIRLYGGNHLLEISDQVQFFTKSPVIMNGGMETLSPQIKKPKPQDLPDEEQLKRELTVTYHDNSPVHGADVDIVYADGSKFSTKLDSSGNADLTAAPDKDGSLHIGEDIRKYEIAKAEANPEYKANYSDDNFKKSMAEAANEQEQA